MKMVAPNSQMCTDDPMLHNRLEENDNTAINSTITEHNREEKMMKQKEEIHLDSREI